MVLAFNESDKPLAAGQKAEIVGGQNHVDAAEIQVVIPPEDVAVIFIE